MTHLRRLAFAISLVTLAASAASAADLKITVKGIHNTTGSVYVVVYDETNYGKAELAKFKEKAPAAKGDVSFAILSKDQKRGVLSYSASRTRELPAPRTSARKKRKAQKRARTKTKKETPLRPARSNSPD